MHVYVAGTTLVLDYTVRVAGLNANATGANPRTIIITVSFALSDATDVPDVTSDDKHRALSIKEYIQSKTYGYDTYTSSDYKHGTRTRTRTRYGTFLPIIRLKKTGRSNWTAWSFGLAAPTPGTIPCAPTSSPN